MRISKKILACVLAALMAVAMMPFTASAETIGIAPSASTLEYSVDDAEELFESIDDADAAAKIVFTNDIVVTEPVVIEAGKIIKFDLKGHSLSGNIQDEDGKKLIQVSGELEFIGDGGCIYNTNTAGQGHAACQALTGGTIFVNAPINFGDSDTDMTNANNTNRGCGIQNNGGTLIINDGYYTAIDANYTTGAWAYAILNCAGDTVVNNATVYGNGLHGALGCESGTLTVNDGTFAVNGASNYYSLYAAGGVTTVNGGTFTNNGKYGVNYLGTGAETDINGGSFTYTVPFVVSGSKGNPVVTGGTFDGDVTAYLADGCTQTNGTVAQEYVAKIGDTYYATLTAAISAATAGDTVTLLADTSVNTGSSASSRYAISKSLTIDGGNHTVSINNRGFGVGMNASAKIDVTFKNITITNATNAGRCIDTRGNINSLTLDNVTLKTTGTSGYLQPLTIGGNQATTATVNITDSTIQTSNDGSKGYAIITFNPVAMTITDSTIKGWACVYAKGVDGSAGSAGSTFTATGSNFVSKNTNPGTTNAFGTLVVEDSNIDFNITNCNISIDGEANHQYLFTNNEAYLKQYVNPNAEIEDVTVALGEGNNVDLKAMGDFSIGATDDVKLEISGGYFSKVVPAECCADGYASKATPNEQGMYTVGEPDNGANISVADEISQNVYIDTDFYGEESYATIEYNHASNASEDPDFQTETVQLKDLPSLDDPSSAYDGASMLSVIQAPAQSTEPITVNIYATAADAAAGTNAVDTIEYSVYNYCKKIIDEYEGEKADELKDLAKATLDYAAAAQEYFSYNTTDMATKDNGGYYGDVASADLSSVAGISSRPLGVSGVTVVVKSDLEINLLSKTPFTVTGKYLDTEKGGTRFDADMLPDMNGDYYVLNIKGIEPANMNKTITVYTTQGTAELTANSVMKLMANYGDAKMQTLAKAMYLYGQAANTYFG